MAHAIQTPPVGSRNPSTGPALTLSLHCSIEAGTHLIDVPVFRGTRTAIGVFRCPVTYPGFRDTGPIERCIVVFPRTGVWIQHEGGRRFLADPTVVTIYNRAQRYERFAASPRGDWCDWFAIADDIAREIASTFDPAAAEWERPFRFQWAPSDAPLYVRQRALLQRARRGTADALEVEEEILRIVVSVLAAAHRRGPAPLARRARAGVRHRELADAARAYIAEHVTASSSLHDVASTLGTSPYHLCRVFRACTGRTMHDYRNELRVRTALELLEGAVAPSRSISALAYRLGFSSHSHFVRAMRRHAGITPSTARRLCVP